MAAVIDGDTRGDGGADKGVSDGDREDDDSVDRIDGVGVVANIGDGGGSSLAPVGVPALLFEPLRSMRVNKSRLSR